MANSQYAIEYAESVADDLAELRAFERKAILDAIEQQLLYEPTQETRHKKILFGLIPPWVVSLLRAGGARSKLAAN
ncbi:MAG: hypothetical protein AB1750_04100 [Chloroflexota bacterium]